ncbi:MAG: hypothetical protein L6R42_009541 [Xanthoria sp. 1 TBL-2021]|nr:MAG: hypothetical protein L6R42_009541 [Xanthoria sp. 1 TBL-2021]
MLRPCRVICVALSVFGFLAFSITRPAENIPPLTQPASSGVFTADDGSFILEKGLLPAGSSERVKNSTLGFERVFVINLPERFDKLDAFSLASSLTGFSHDVIEGIKGATVVNKTLPSLDNLPKKERSRNNIVGCWRAHLNFAQMIVRERIQTAIVFEDDSDWDVSFKDQLADFATGTRYISGATTTTRSPYGDDWDLLWLGHCSSQQHPADERRFVIENDDTVPPMSHRVNFNKVPKLNELGYDNSTRIVFRANNGVCLYSYALSYRGAQNVLRWQNNVQKFEPIDIGIGYQCRDDTNFKCIAVFPQLVDLHKSVGRASRDSDIATYDPTQMREKGYTQNIVLSTRLNIDNLMQGGSAAKVEDQ